MKIEMGTGDTIKGFSIGELIKFGWYKMKNNIGFFIGVLLLVFILPNIPYMISFTLGKEFTGLHFLLVVVNYFLNLLMMLGLVKISLIFSNNDKPRYSDLFNVFPLIWKYFIAHILFALILLVGFLLLVFPMVIWGTRYGLFPYFIVERGVGPIESLKLSAKTTLGAKWDLFSLYLVSAFIYLIGFLCLGIGLFAAIPVVMIAQALAYRKLLAQTSELGLH